MSMMQLTGRFANLRKLCVGSDIVLRRVLTAFGKTSPCISSMEVSSKLYCTNARDLHLILPKLTHLTVNKDRDFPILVCLDMLGCHSLTFISIIGFDINPEVWQLLPDALQHLSCSASKVSPDMDGVTAEKPHLQSLTAVSKDCISADGLAQLLRLSPSVGLLTLSQHDPYPVEQPIPRSRSIVQVFATYGVPVASRPIFPNIAFLDEKVQNGSLKIKPEGLHLQLLCPSFQAVGYVRDMFEGMQPLLGTTGLTLDLTHNDDLDVLPHDMHSNLPNISAFNLIAVLPPSSALLAQLSASTSLKRIMLDSGDPRNDPSNICLLCSQLPSLQVLELSDEGNSEIEDLLGQQGIPTQVVRFAGGVILDLGGEEVGGDDNEAEGDGDGDEL